MILTLDLNAEETAALEAVVADHNAGSSDAPLSATQYLERGLRAQVEAYTRAAFDASVRRLAEAADSLPYEQRLQVIAAVESQLTPS